METVNEALGLLRRQAELEALIKEPGEFRIEEKQELRFIRRRLAHCPEALGAAIQAAHALRRSVTEVTASEVEEWVRTTRSA